VRFIGWWRSRLLWSLRNRLIVAYLFHCPGAYPMILTLGVLAGRILYSQLGAYLLYEDIHARINTVSDISEHIAAAHATPPRGITREEMEAVLAAQAHTVHDRELPGLSIAFADDPELLRKLSRGGDFFAGLFAGREQVVALLYAGDARAEWSARVEDTSARDAGPFGGHSARCWARFN